MVIMAKNVSPCTFVCTAASGLSHKPEAQHPTIVCKHCWAELAIVPPLHR